MPMGAGHCSEMEKRWEREVATRYGDRTEGYVQGLRRGSDCERDTDLSDDDVLIDLTAPDDDVLIDLTAPSGITGAELELLVHGEPSAALEATDNRIDPASLAWPDGSRSLTKRMVDVVGALVGIVVLMPLWLTIGLALRLASPGPAFFAQHRVGMNGELFTVRKFRTMYTDADHVLAKVLSEDPALSREYATFHKLGNDPRVTRIGRLLRQTSLDEIPQLWNVLIGEMSLVGPRPYLPHEICEMHSLETGLLQCKPGLTGLWQISGRNDLSFDERLVIDLTYVGTWSLSLDAKIMLKTIPVVLSGSGAS